MLRLTQGQNTWHSRLNSEVELTSSLSLREKNAMLAASSCTHQIVCSGMDVSNENNVECNSLKPF